MRLETSIYAVFSDFGIMLRHIPIVQTESGKLVVSSCSKAEGPFTCLGCGGGLVLLQGKVNVYHFAHCQHSLGCSGWGESAQHNKAAKLLVEKYCSRLYTDCDAKQEYRYHNNINYSADVAIFQNHSFVPIVEISVAHVTTGDALERRTACVGANSVWEIAAGENLSQQTELFTTQNTVEIPSLLRYELDECTPMCHRRDNAAMQW
ncbi:unnamed protein product [Ectocarpus sp. CCAP 1310/34]|nr:unnamed protein product [Ectocarpus sp. CCAP 1310/34]